MYACDFYDLSFCGNIFKIYGRSKYIILKLANGVLTTVINSVIKSCHDIGKVIKFKRIIKMILECFNSKCILKNFICLCIKSRPEKNKRIFDVMSKELSRSFFLYFSHIFLETTHQQPREKRSKVVYETLLTSYETLIVY